MGDYKPCVVTANDQHLIPLGSEVFCDARTLTSSFVPFQLAGDIKGFDLYVISGTAVVRGTSPVSVALLDAGALTDNGDGTVTIPAANHGFAHDGSVYATIAGTTYYDGYWLLEAASDANNLVITPTAHVVYLDAAAAVDNGDGTVTLPCAAHGFIDGDTVTIAGTTNYNGAEVLGVASDADNLVITAAYVAETFDGTETATGMVGETILATATATSYRDCSIASTAIQPRSFPVAVEANTTICELKSADAAVVNIIAWR
ncbi:MAG: hypothetical protein WC891_08835 [Actinomycetota bacterium]